MNIEYRYVQTNNQGKAYKSIQKQRKTNDHSNKKTNEKNTGFLDRTNKQKKKAWARFLCNRTDRHQETYKVRTKTAKDLVAT